MLRFPRKENAPLGWAMPVAVHIQKRLKSSDHWGILLSKRGLSSSAFPEAPGISPEEVHIPTSQESQEASQCKDGDCSYTGGWSSEEFKDSLSCNNSLVLTTAKDSVKWVNFRKTDGSCPQTSHLPLTPSQSLEPARSGSVISLGKFRRSG